MTDHDLHAHGIDDVHRLPVDAFLEGRCARVAVAQSVFVAVGTSNTMIVRDPRGTAQ